MSKREKSFLHRRVRTIISPFKKLFNRKTTWGRFPDYLFLDPEKIAEELGAESQGSLDGSRKIPPSNAVDYDWFHRRLIDVFKENFRHANDGRKRILQEKERQINGYGLPDLSREMQRKVDEFSICLNELFLTVKDDLEEAYRKSCESERNYTFFRTSHKRIDPPKETHLLVLTISSVLLMIALEAGVNSVFLQDATNYGKTGGAAIAAIVSAANIAAAMLAGWSARYINYTDPQKENWYSKKRTSFFCAFGSFLLVMLSFSINCLFSGFRTIVVEEETIDVLPKLLPRMKEDIGFWVEPSWLLFSIGMIFGIIAFYEGYSKFSDTYPRYSSVFQQKVKAKKEYNDIIRKINFEFKKLYDRQVDDLENIVLDAKNNFLTLKKDVDEFRYMISIHNSEVIESENILNSIAKKYREANIAHRGESPAPLYFSLPLSLDEKYISDNIINIEDLDVIIKDSLSSIEHYKEIKNELCAKLLVKFQKELESLQENIKRIEGIVEQEVCNTTESLTYCEEEQNNFK